MSAEGAPPPPVRIDAPAPLAWAVRRIGWSGVALIAAVAVSGGWADTLLILAGLPPLSGGLDAPASGCDCAAEVEALSAYQRAMWANSTATQSAILRRLGDCEVPP